MKEKFKNHNFSSGSLERLALINAILEEYEADGFDLTLRQLYYQLVARGHLENTQRNYKNLGKLVSNARLAGLIDWAMIADRGRGTHRLSNWENPGEIIQSAVNSFRLDKWEKQPYYIRVIVEKDALSGVLQPVCEDLDIGLTAAKGYASQSLFYTIAKTLRWKKAAGKKIAIIHLADHDPSGIDMSRDIEDRFGLLSRKDIQIFRLALNMDQVDDFHPPENPAKVTDSRYESYQAEYGESSWELDAIEPKFLSEIVRDFVEERIDWDIWNDTQEQEKNYKDELQEFANNYEL